MNKYETIYKKNTKRVVKDIKAFEEKLKLEKYYELSKILKKVGAFLYDFIMLYDRIRNIKEMGFPNYNNKYYKFIYEDEMVKYLNKDKTTISKKINTLVALGLVEKLNIYDKEIASDSTIINSLEKAKANGNRPVNYFHIPNYTHKLLKYSNDVATKLLENKYTIKKFNKAFLISIFGQDFANKVFLDKRTIPIEFKNMQKDIEDSIIKTIDKKGIIKVNDFKKVFLEKNTIKDKKSKNIINNNIELILNKLIEERIIIKRKLTKKEKEIYDIEKDNKYQYILRGEEWKNG